MLKGWEKMFNYEDGFYITTIDLNSTYQNATVTKSEYDFNFQDGFIEYTKDYPNEIIIFCKGIQIKKEK